MTDSNKIDNIFENISKLFRDNNISNAITEIEPHHQEIIALLTTNRDRENIKTFEEKLGVKAEHFLAAIRTLIDIRDKFSNSEGGGSSNGNDIANKTTEDKPKPNFIFIPENKGLLSKRNPVNPEDDSPRQK